MSISYLNKSVTLKNNGATVTSWMISNIFILNNVNPAQIKIRVSVQGYVDLQTLQNGLQSLPGAGSFYNLDASHFPASTDLTNVSIAQIYAAILVVANGNQNDILNAAVLTEI